MYSIFANDEVVLAMTKFGNLLHSKDNGKTWTENNIGNVIIRYIEEENRLLAVSSPDGIIQSTDMGKSWELLNKTYPSGGLYLLGDKYYFVHNRSLYTSDSTFKEVKEIKRWYDYSYVVSLHEYKDTVFATGNFSRGLVYTVDDFKSWHTYNHYLDSLNINFYRKLIFKDNIFIGAVGGLYNESIYVSEDYMNTIRFSPFFGSSIEEMLLLDNNRLFINGQNLRFSDDLGKTFKYLDTSVVKPEYEKDELAQLSTGELLIFTAFQKGVFRSTDNGDSWEKIADSLDAENLKYARINGFYEFDDVLYITVNLDPMIILESYDRGATWTKSDLDEEMFSSVTENRIWMVSADILFNYVYQSVNDDYHGLYYSDTGGKEWTKIDMSELLPAGKSFYYRSINILDDYIYFSALYDKDSLNTYKYNFFRAKFSDLGIKTSVAETDGNQQDYLVYPQPGKEQITIELQPKSVAGLPQAEVYNSEGKLLPLANVTIEQMEGNKLRVIWDCSGVSQGVYHLSLDYGTEEQSVKVVVGE